jgi:hypothetical protein
MWRCPTGCKIVEVVACLPSGVDPNLEMEVMVDAQTGKATNHFYDGIRGVPEDLKSLAEADENPMCPNCLSECDWVTRFVAGFYNRYGYEIYLKVGGMLTEELYSAGNSCEDSTAVVDEDGESLRTMRKYCVQTGKEIAEDMGIPWLGASREDDNAG